MPLWLIGCVGAIAAEVLYFYQMREDRPPAHVKRWYFWLITIGMVLVGGFIVELYSEQNALGDNKILAFHIGASVPAILGNLVLNVGTESIRTN